MSKKSFKVAYREVRNVWKGKASKVMASQEDYDAARQCFKSREKKEYAFLPNKRVFISLRFSNMPQTYPIMKQELRKLITAKRKVIKLP